MAKNILSSSVEFVVSPVFVVTELKKAEMAVNQGKSELADCIRIAAQNGDTQVLDVSGHYWVDVDNKKDIERAKRVLAKYSQKKRVCLVY